MAMRPVTVAFRFFPLVVLVLMFSPPLVSQTNTGRIFGTVTDQTGAAINAAKVVVTDVQRGVTRSLTTDEAGAYVAPNLLSGTYKVRAEAKGFKTVERINIVLEVAKDVIVDVQLQPGEVKETVVVTEEVPLLDTASSTL
jgi:trimeric autotransporter adhesin